MRALDAPGKTNRSFFNLAQAHVGESVQFALVTMNTPSQSAKGSSFGMARREQPGRTSKGGWSRQMVSPSVSTGRSQEVAPRPATPSSTDAQVAEGLTMEPSCALKQRRLEALSLYNHEAWATKLACLSLRSRYPSLTQGLANGFDLGIPQIPHTYTPPNHPLIRSLIHVYNGIVEHEFALGHYIGLFMCS